MRAELEVVSCVMRIVHLACSQRGGHREEYSPVLHLSTHGVRKGSGRGGSGIIKSRFWGQSPFHSGQFACVNLG